MDPFEVLNLQPKYIPLDPPPGKVILAIYQRPDSRRYLFDTPEQAAEFFAKYVYPTWLCLCQRDYEDQHALKSGPPMHLWLLENGYMVDDPPNLKLALLKNRRISQHRTFGPHAQIRIYLGPHL